MRSFLREFSAARYDLFVVWLAFAAFVVGGCTARGDEEPRAALALAKAKRDRERVGCHTDLLAARLEARRTNRSLVYWVNTTCAAHAELRAALHDAVHCHLKSWNNDRTPRLVYFDEDGHEFAAPADALSPESEKRIRAKWPNVGLLRGDAGVREE